MAANTGNGTAGACFAALCGKSRAICASRIPDQNLPGSDRGRGLEVVPSARTGGSANRVTRPESHVTGAAPATDTDAMDPAETPRGHSVVHDTTGDEAELAAVLAVVLAGIASGESRIAGLPDTEPTRRAIDAMSALGARMEFQGGELVATGTGNGCLLAAEHPLEFGDAAAAGILLLGLTATYDMETRFLDLPEEGDRLIAMLREMGVQATTGREPSVGGPKVAAPIVADCIEAQPAIAVAVLLAGLNAPGITSVACPPGMPAAVVTLFCAFDADVVATESARGAVLSLIGQTDLAAASLDLGALS